MQTTEEIESLKLYSDGWNARIQGRIDDAEKIFRQVTTQYPSTDAARYSSIQISSLKPATFVAAIKTEVKNDVVPEKKVKPVKPANGISALSIIAIVLSTVALLVSIYAVYNQMTLNKRIEYEAALSSARTALYHGDKNAFDRALLRAYRYGEKDNGASFLEIDAALMRDDIKSALRILKRCPVVDEDVSLYLKKIKDHSSSGAGRNGAENGQ